MLLNKTRLDSLLARSGLAAIIVAKPENAIYISGFHPMGSRSIRDRLSYVVYFSDPDASPVAIVPSADLRHTRELSWIPSENIVGYTEFKTDNDSGLITDKYKYIAQVLHERGLESGTIGVEQGFLPVDVLDRIRAVAPSASFKDCTGLLKSARAVKMAEEIRRLRRAEEATEKGCRRMIELAAAGHTEIRVASEGRATSLLDGAETIGFTMVGGGTRSAFVHNNPRDERIRPGEVFRFDFGAIYDGYWGDLARTFVFGRKPTAEQQKVYDTILKTQETALAALRPGATADEVYRKAVEAGRTIDPSLRREHVGHGVGLEVHEEPLLRAGNEMVIEPGMVICVEAGKYVPDLGGFQVEDTVIITETGVEVLSSMPKQLFQPGV
ncbi:MAG: Xaa-Pro peptidase family protein [Firmicutes bacterium]|jgi:Xaa-Pro aminopeptidase|nr:Xaa-Pro peptidase family protein [Bacillota bacterium]